MQFLGTGTVVRIRYRKGDVFQETPVDSSSGSTASSNRFNLRAEGRRQSGLRRLSEGASEVY